jgi:hypothetical protein
MKIYSKEFNRFTNLKPSINNKNIDLMSSVLILGGDPFRCIGVVSIGIDVDDVSLDDIDDLRST